MEEAITENTKNEETENSSEGTFLRVGDVILVLLCLFVGCLTSIKMMKHQVEMKFKNATVVYTSRSL